MWRVPIAIPEPIRIAVRTVHSAVKQFVEDEVLTRAAALAFYSALSLAPLMLMLVSVTGLVINPQQQEAMVSEIEQTVGPEGAAAIHTVVDNVRLERETGWLAFIVSIATLLLGATAVFVQLQWTMNRIWGVELKSHGIIRTWLYRRLISLAVIGALGLLLLGSLMLTTAAAALVSEEDTGLWHVLDWTLSILIFTLLFTAMFRWLPDVKVAWMPSLIGALITAILFAVGKRAIGIYLGTSTLASAYGAAGSLIALLLWVYYSSLIIFFGAELTEALARNLGQRVQPDEYAERTPGPHHGEPAV